jgi:hypothetical protein
MAVTANRSYPYSIAADSPAGHTQIQALATAVDVDMANVDRFFSGYMTADISVTSSTVYVNATGLSFVMAANTRYSWEAKIFFSAVGAADLKFGWTAPALTTNIYGIIGLDSTATAGTGDTNFIYRTLIDQVIGAPTVVSNTFAVVTGTLQTGANAGTYQIQFAQQVSDATATTVRANSVLTARRL